MSKLKGLRARTYKIKMFHPTMMQVGVVLLFYQAIAYVNGFENHMLPWWLALLPFYFGPALAVAFVAAVVGMVGCVFAIALLAGIIDAIVKR